MENQNIETAEQTVLETNSETATETATETTPQQTSRKKIYKDQDFYPYCAIIMCICAAVGHVVGSYLLNNPQLYTCIGMIVGIIGAIVFVKKGGKQIDDMPTKARKKKEEK